MLNAKPLNLTPVTEPKISSEKVRQFRFVIQSANDLVGYGNYFVSQLRIAAELYHHLMSIESYNLKKKIFLPHLKHIPRTQSELMKDHPRILFNIVNKGKNQSGENLNMDTVLKSSFDTSNAKSDCFTMSQNPALGELIQLSDVLLISMMNASCPYIFEHAARRNPLEDGIESLFNAFKIHAAHQSTIENPTDADVRKDLDAYLCYFLNWILSDFNSLVMNLNKMLFYAMTKAELMASDITRVIKLVNSLPLMSSRASLLSPESTISVSCETSALMAGSASIFKKFERVDFIGAMQNLGDFRENSDQLYLEINKNFALRADDFPIITDLSEERVIEVLSSELSDLKNRLRQLNEAREGVFKLLPGLAATHQILFLEGGIDKKQVFENDLNDLVLAQASTLHETVTKWKKLLPFKLKYLQADEDDKKYAHMLRIRRVLLSFLEKYVAHVEQFQKFSSKVDELSQKLKESEAPVPSLSSRHRRSASEAHQSPLVHTPPSLLFASTPSSDASPKRAPSAPRERSSSVVTASSGSYSLSSVMPSVNSSEQQTSSSSSRGNADRTSGPGIIRRFLGV